MKKIYTYYKKIEDDEHMLFASEIAKAFGIMSESTKPHSAFLKAYLKYYIEKTKDRNKYDQLYYITFKYGKPLEVEVYPKWIYLRAMYELYLILEDINKVYEIDINEKKYKVKRVEV